MTHISYFRATQNLVEARRLHEVDKEVNEEIEDNDDIVFLPTVDSELVAPSNIKVSIIQVWTIIQIRGIQLNINQVLNKRKY